MRAFGTRLVPKAALAASVVHLAAVWAGAGDLLDIAGNILRRRAATQATVLEPGRPVAGLAGNAATRRYYRLLVPAGQARLTVLTTGGRGDCDLYLQPGKPPTASAHSHRSVGASTEEKITLAAPAPGWWYILVKGSRAYTGVTLLAEAGTGHRPGRVPPGVDDRATELQRSQHLPDLSGGARSRRYFRLAVPAGAQRLTVWTSGGKGDCDLYLARARLPEPKDYDLVSNGSETAEKIAITRPAAGTWYVLLYGFGEFRDVGLSVTWRGESGRRPPGTGRWIQILSPTPGVTWRAGRAYWIGWQASARTRRVRVTYSFDDGRTWKLVGSAAHVPAADGRVLWRIPAAPGLRGPRTARIRILDLDRPTVHVTSVPFTVAHGPRGRPPGPVPGRDPRIDPHEPDDRTAQASPIRLNASQRRTIFPANNEDWLAFVPPRPGAYRLLFRDVTVGLKVRLYAARAGRSRENKIATHTVRKATSIDLNAAPGVRYFKIQIEAREGGDTGAYGVAVTAVPTAPTTRPVPRPRPPRRR